MCPDSCSFVFGTVASVPLIAVPVIAVVSAADGITPVAGVTALDGVPAIGFILHTRLKGVAL